MIQKDPENKLSPLPGHLEKYRDGIANFGLYFQKFGKYNIDREGAFTTQHSWDNGKKGKAKKNYEWSLIINQLEQYQSKKALYFPALAKKHKNQKEFLTAFSKLGSGVTDLSAANHTRFLAGIGETTPTEVGMVFDRNIGVPYIPASSIKGAVRYAYCINFARNNPEKIRDNKTVDEKEVSGLVELFGSLDTKSSSRGGYLFMDVYTEKPPELVIDIMNPHHGKYYKGENFDGPVETEEPIPIKFLAVEKGEKFHFRGIFLTKKAESYRKELIDAFYTAFKELGIGAKTAVGYGRFEIINSDSFLNSKVKTLPVKKTKTPAEKMLEALKLIKPTEIGRISGEIINRMEQELKTDNEKAEIAKAIKEKISAKAFKKLNKKKGGYLSELIKKHENSE